jgi:hypothetical protein
MSLVVFEPTIPVFERTKMVRVIDRAATVIGLSYSYISIILNIFVILNKKLQMLFFEVRCIHLKM